MPDLAAYGGLFLTAFVSATLLPAQSEALFAALQAQGYALPLLLVCGSAGNVLGSLVNWLLGRFLERFRGRRWFPVSDAALERAGRHYRRWGHWSLLLSWMPVIGDPLTLVAGVLREPLGRFLLVVTLAKTGRYLALAGLVGVWL
jgi:membrane protein YqaA with SNARE-associated domain